MSGEAHEDCPPGEVWICNACDHGGMPCQGDWTEEAVE